MRATALKKTEATLTVAERVTRELAEMIAVHVDNHSDWGEEWAFEIDVDPMTVEIDGRDYDVLCEGITRNYFGYDPGDYWTQPHVWLRDIRVEIRDLTYWNDDEGSVEAPIYIDYRELEELTRQEILMNN